MTKDDKAIYICGLHNILDKIFGLLVNPITATAIYSYIGYSFIVSGNYALLISFMILTSIHSIMR